MINNVKNHQRVTAVLMNSIIDLLNELAKETQILREEHDKIKEKLDIHPLNIPKMDEVEEAYECKNTEK